MNTGMVYTLPHLRIEPIPEETLSETHITDDNSRSSMEACPICIEPMHENVTVTTHCGHTFHEECLVKSLAFDISNFRPMQCPMCRLGWI